MRIASTAALGLLSVLITALALGLLGTFFPDLPYLGLATGFLPPAMSLAIVAAFAAALGLSIRWWRRRDWFSGALAVVSVVTLIGGTVVNVRMIDAVERAGADVDVLDTLDVLAGPTVASRRRGDVHDLRGRAAEGQRLPAGCQEAIVGARPRLRPRRRLGRRTP